MITFTRARAARILARLLVSPSLPLSLSLSLSRPHFCPLHRTLSFADRAQSKKNFIYVRKRSKRDRWMPVEVATMTRRTDDRTDNSHARKTGVELSNTLRCVVVIIVTGWPAGGSDVLKLERAARFEKSESTSVWLEETGTVGRDTKRSDRVANAHSHGNDLDQIGTSRTENGERSR